MCKIITATINADANFEWIRHLLTEPFPDFDVIERTAVASMLPPDRAYLVHPGYCSCGSDIGSGSLALVPIPDVPEIERHRGEGWSEAKLERWLSEKFKTTEEARRRAPGYEEATQWLQLIDRLLSSKSVWVFGLMHHWYRGGLDSEEFQVKLLPQVRLEDAEPEMLLDLKDGELLEFVR